METKDYIIISLSSLALLISLVSLIITLIQKHNETKRTIRKSLTDTLENISKIEIETTRLKSSNVVDFNSEPIINLRRNFNSQRRILIVHADFLIEKYDKIVTEIDCNILAGAYSIIGDQEKAEYFWAKTIDKSKSATIKHMNLRGFGIFLFHNGKIPLGREKFEAALELKLSENDANKVLITDTYLILADLELNFDDKKQYEINLTKAMEICSLIENKTKKSEMQDRIRLKLPRNN